MATTTTRITTDAELGVITMHVANLVRAFERAEAGLSGLTAEVLRMPGMSGTKTRHFLNNLLQLPGARYLEIGMWQGSTTCAAMHGNAAMVVGIDNWSQFNGPREECLANCQRHMGANKLRVLDGDCWKIPLSNLGGPFNLYLYDGDHEYKAHHAALMHYIDAMDDVFTFLVDDWNWPTVRDGTRHAIADLGLQVVYEREIRPTLDNTHTPTEEAAVNWWNGWYAAVLRKPSKKPAIQCPTPGPLGKANRTL